MGSNPIDESTAVELTRKQYFRRRAAKEIDRRGLSITVDEYLEMAAWPIKGDSA